MCKHDPVFIYILFFMASTPFLSPVVHQDKSVYWEDWGEGLTSKSVPVLCVADVAKGTVTVLQGVPSHVSPGQVSKNGASHTHTHQ